MEFIIFGWPIKEGIKMGENMKKKMKAITIIIFLTTLTPGLGDAGALGKYAHFPVSDTVIAYFC